jgi:hypothetical protein
MSFNKDREDFSEDFSVVAADGLQLANSPATASMNDTLRSSRPKAKDLDEACKKMSRTYDTLKVKTLICNTRP